ncbi:unnamed protein product [Didymodactylos carnosus]|uniref:Uncharacterized protein n=1 Tax=Didymodactylos carnosus TaxID=1234261 RepID=A0A815H290_9BILA|nr:unnamed protein product [Didymodactylos carnosus]CAF4210392.1 unnamed protein product [Didymodactylos carnosus]
MNNFFVFYNALCRAFDRENVAMPPSLINILKPADIVQPPPYDSNQSNVDIDSDSDEEKEDADVGNFSDEYDFDETYLKPPPPTTTTSQQQENPLDLDDDIKRRHDIYRDLYCLIFGIRKQRNGTSKTTETYVWPPLIKQIIRCRHPSDVKNYECYQTPDIIFTVQSFIGVFRV